MAMARIIDSMCVCWHLTLRYMYILIAPRGASAVLASRRNDKSVAQVWSTVIAIAYGPALVFAAVDTAPGCVVLTGAIAVLHHNPPGRHHANAVDGTVHL